MTTPNAIEEKLYKFQAVCEEKLRKITVLHETYEQNEILLKKLISEVPSQVELTKLNLDLVTAQHLTGKNGLTVKIAQRLM